MRKLAAIVWLLGILACGEEPGGVEVLPPVPAVQPAGLVVPVAGIRG
ncbi:MAG: hypothetical protein LC110_00425 [Burkholderiales bacterium]|nr:hypothetical protein [Burkholderiales bacterium]